MTPSIAAACGVMSNAAVKAPCCTAKAVVRQPVVLVAQLLAGELVDVGTGVAVALGGIEVAGADGAGVAVVVPSSQGCVMS